MRPTRPRVIAPTGLILSVAITLTMTMTMTMTAAARAAEFPAFRMQELDPHVGNICYAVTTADVNGDGKLDVVAVTEDAVVWFANPDWKKHTIIGNGAT